MTKPAEEEAFEALKKGSQEAFKRVYEQNRERFIRFARKYSLGDDDILDIYQDAYIAFFENVQKGKLTELKSSIATYVTAIGKYKILERLRSRSKNAPVENRLQVVGEMDQSLDAFELEQEPLSPQQLLLRQHFERLGEKCREILRMFYYRGMNIKEIKTAGNYNSENVVKSQKSRCLKTLREAIQKSEGR